MLSRTPKDIDLFFVPEPECKEPGKALAERCKEFVKEVYTWINQSNAKVKEFKEKGKSQNSHKIFKIDDLVITRHKGTYTIHLPCCPIPIQISLCKSIPQLFSQVDIAPTQIAYFNKQIMISEEAKFALENMSFYVDFSNKNSKYLARILKYFDKGFDIILPDLALEKLDRRNLKFSRAEVLDLPFLTVVYSAINGNKISVDSIEIPTNFSCDESPASIAQYSANANRMNFGVIIHKNIQHLIRGRYSEFTYHGAGELFGTVFECDLDITERMIYNTYETFSKKVYKDGSMDLNILENFISVKKVSDILDEVMVQYAKEHATQPVIFDNNYNEHVRVYFEKLVAEQIAATKKMILSIAGKGTLEFPLAKQSVKVQDKKDWYGEYLLAE